MFVPIDMRIDRISNFLPSFCVFTNKKMREAVVSKAKKKKNRLVNAFFTWCTFNSPIWIVQECVKCCGVPTQGIVNMSYPLCLGWGRRQAKEKLVKIAAVACPNVVALLRKVVIVELCKVTFASI